MFTKLLLLSSHAAEHGIRCLQVHISYLEIYNETGYDLLNPDREVQMLEDLPKVAIMEDEESNIHMRNLSIHRANNEEEALNLVSMALILTFWSICSSGTAFWTICILK